MIVLTGSGDEPIDLPEFDDVVAAAGRLQGRSVITPVMRAECGGKLCGCARRNTLAGNKCDGNHPGRNALC